MDGTSRQWRAALSITWPPAECLLVLSVAHNWLKPPHLGLEQTFTCSRSCAPEQIAFWQRTAAHDKEKNVFAKFNAKIWESFDLIKSENGSLIFIYHHITSVRSYNLCASKLILGNAHSWAARVPRMITIAAQLSYTQNPKCPKKKNILSGKPTDSWEWRLLSVNVHELLLCVCIFPTHNSDILLSQTVGWKQSYVSKQTGRRRQTDFSDGVPSCHLLSTFYPASQVKHTHKGVGEIAHSRYPRMAPLQVQNHLEPDCCGFDSSPHLTFRGLVTTK